MRPCSRQLGLALALVLCGCPTMDDGDTADGGDTGGSPSGTDAVDDDGMVSAPGESDGDGDGNAASSGDDGDGGPDGGTDTGGTDVGGADGTDGTDGGGGLPPGIGLIQYDADAHFGDYQTNLSNLTTWATVAVDRGARIVVFPEGSTYGYASATHLWCTPGMTSYAGKQCQDVSAVAESLPGGPTTTYWESFAAEHDVHVVFHVPEIDQSTYYTSLGVVGPEGYVARYRKRSLYYVDQAFAQPGNEAVVLETALGDFGLMLCLDGTYNGPYYDGYKAMGVDAVIISMDWDEDPYSDWAAKTWFADRARDNDIVIYGSDVSTWDGTAKYIPSGPRERDGLPAVAIGQDGVSFHALP